MISKAEILYLRGQKKRTSESDERKSKCLIIEKLEYLNSIFSSIKCR